MPNKDESDIIINKLESSILLIGLRIKTNIICKILYPFSEINHNTVIMIYYMYKYYKKVYIYKPLQTLTNNEFYIICYDFDDKKIDKNYNNLEFTEKNIDEKYYYSLYKIYKNNNNKNYYIALYEKE